MKSVQSLTGLWGITGGTFDVMIAQCLVSEHAGKFFGEKLTDVLRGGCFLTVECHRRGYTTFMSLLIDEPPKLFGTSLELSL